MPVAFDEMKGLDEEVRTAYAVLDDWLKGQSPELLGQRCQEAEIGRAHV